MDWRWEHFLGRPDIMVTDEVAASAVKGKRVLIIGAGGSIGLNLAKGVLRGQPETLILADSSEYSLYEAYRNLTALAERVTIIPLLGDILELHSIRHVLQKHRPQVIFHAAAYKHLSLLEGNPFAALRNNAIGTLHLVQSVLEAGDCRLILLSTDKAVQPCNIMGVSKRIAEMILLSHREAGLKGSVVRLSNVLGSSGSVVPLFREQLQKGHALTVTHAQVRRFWITANEASVALLVATSDALAGLVIVPAENEPIAVIDLAKYMGESGISADANSRPVAIEWIGLQAGEKLDEKLTWESEFLVETLDCGLRVFASPSPILSELLLQLAALEESLGSFDEPAMLHSVRELVPGYGPSVAPADLARVGVGKFR